MPEFRFLAQAYMCEITGLIIFCYRFFYSLLKPAAHQKYCKRCKFVASVGSPPDPAPGALPPGPPLRETPVVGSRYCAHHGPHTFWHLPAPMTAGKIQKTLTIVKIYSLWPLFWFETKVSGRWSLASSTGKQSWSRSQISATSGAK